MLQLISLIVKDAQALKGIAIIEHVFYIIPTMLEINEPVNIVAVFKNGLVSPRKIGWRGRTLRVDKVTGRWMSSIGSTNILNLSLMTEGGDYFELSFNSKTYIWRLEKLETPC